MSQRRAPTIAARRVFQPLAMQRTAVPGIAAERILIAGPKGLQCLPATMAPLARVAFAATRRPLPAAFPPVQTALFSAKTTYETAKDRTSAGNGSQSSIPAWRAVIRRPFRKLFGLLAAGAVLGYAYSSLTDPTFSERMRRLRRVYGTFLPSFLEYKYNTLFVLRNASEDEKAAKYLDLDRKWAPNYLETILDLRGAYVKFAQVVLTRPDLLESEEFRRVLAPLLDSVPQEPSDVIEAIVCRNLGISSISEAFDDFEPTALGTASIAQVHGAKLKDGTEVVIKVRLPNAERNFDLDLRTMEAMVRMAQPEMLPAHKEIRNMVKRELDFRNEAKVGGQQHALLLSLWFLTAHSFSSYSRWK